jgi:hypothetical protein
MKEKCCSRLCLRWIRSFLFYFFLLCLIYLFIVLPLEYTRSLPNAYSPSHTLPAFGWVYGNYFVHTLIHLFSNIKFLLYQTDEFCKDRTYVGSLNKYEIIQIEDGALLGGVSPKVFYLFQKYLFKLIIVFVSR